jgi:hypothetical protein
LDLLLKILVVLGLLGNFLLQLGLELFHILISEELVGGLHLDLKETRLASLAL